MVGVPRSRGCVGCRQQKKKCIVLSKPPCSRCRRLDISCVGYGERRLKFQDESQNFDTASSIPVSSRSLPKNPFHTLQEDANPGGATIFINPIGTLTPLIYSFTRSVDGQGADTGHHLTWNYGSFLDEVPRFLGFNEALDATADALAASYAHFRRNGCSGASAICLGKYSHALKCLRNCLSTVENACEPATLCATMILIIVETLLGMSGTAALTHAGGAAAILKCRGTRPPKDELERRILMTLRGPVVVQAFFLDEAYFTAVEWKSLTSGYSLEGDVTEDGCFPGLAAAARLFQSTRRVLSQDPRPQQDTEQLTSRAFALHQILAKRLSELSERFDKARDSWLMDRNDIEAKFAHGHYVRHYGLALSTQITVNCMLSALHTDCCVITETENTTLSREICRLGETETIHHRPLGSAWVYIALSLAYVGATSDEDKARAANVYADSMHDFSGETTPLPTIELEQFAAFVRCSDLSVKRDVCKEAVAGAAL